MRSGARLPSSSSARAPEASTPASATTVGDAASGAVSGSGVSEMFPAAAFDSLISAARPPKDLGIVRAHSRPDELQLPYTEVGGDPHGSPEISGERGFDENQGSQGHRKI